MIKMLIIGITSLVILSCTPQSTTPTVIAQGASVLSIQGSGDFGELPLNTTKIQTLTITNAGGESSIINPTVSGAGFSLAYTNCSSLAIGKSCLIKVLLNTQNLSAGTQGGNLTISQGNEVLLTGEVQIPEIQVGYEVLETNSQVSSLNFGEINHSHTGLIKTLTVRNVDKVVPEPLSISLTNNDQFQVVFNNCKPLKIKERCQVKVSVAPGVNSGLVEDVLNINGQEIPLSVTINVPPLTEAQVTSDVKFFNNQAEADLVFNQMQIGDKYQIQTVLVKNSGNGSAGMVTIDFNDPNYQILYNSCNQPLRGHTSCMIKILVNSQAPGPINVTGLISAGNSQLSLNTRIINPDSTPPQVFLAQLQGGNGFPEARYTNNNSALGNVITPEISYTDENLVVTKFSTLGDCSNGVEEFSVLNFSLNQENEYFVQLTDEAGYSTNCLSLGKVIHDNIPPQMADSITVPFYTVNNALEQLQINFSESISSMSQVEPNLQSTEYQILKSGDDSILVPYQEFSLIAAGGKLINDQPLIDPLPEYTYSKIQIKLQDKAGNITTFNPSPRYLMTSSLKTSCEEALNLNSTLTDDQYYVDIDGPGLATPAVALCAMNKKNKTYFPLLYDTSAYRLNNGSSQTEFLLDFVQKASTNTSSIQFSGVLDLIHNGTTITTQMSEYEGGSYSNLTFCNGTQDSQMCMVRFKGNTTLSGTNIPSVRKKGLVIYVDGDLTINAGATISMTARGAIASGQNLYLLSGQSIPATGANGGVGVANGTSHINNTGYGNSKFNPLQGSDGTNGQTGGGAAGGSSNFNGYTCKGGNAAAGTSYSGGSGGGGCTARQGSGTGGNAAANGGIGGCAWTTWDWTGWGGVGNGPGQLCSGANATYFGNNNSGTGGLLIVYVKGNLILNGSIQANGVNSLAATSDFTNGGASGGGSVNVYHTGTKTGSGTITANGGTGGWRRAGNGTARNAQVSF